MLNKPIDQNRDLRDAMSEFIYKRAMSEEVVEGAVEQAMVIVSDIVDNCMKLPGGREAIWDVLVANGYEFHALQIKTLVKVPEKIDPSYIEERKWWQQH